VAIIASVNCSATVAKAIAGHFDSSALREFPTIDGVIALTHSSGCGMPLGSTQHALLERVLRGMFQHPNIGAWLLVGLGCEQATVRGLAECTDLLRARTKSDSGAGAAAVLRMQECGGTQKTIAAGIEAVRRILPAAASARREPVPIGEIVLATECGGSDGNSGITANPALGVASDLLVAAGGTTILGETPEIYGAASLLTQRARSGAIAEKLVERIQWWQRHAAAAGASLDQNPSVGNKEGGLTTIWEKSLGAVAKGGSTALEDVYLYAEPVTAKGLVVMDTPGYDPVSVTGMVAGGANIVALTTGRGSCFGCAAAPTIKITSNTPTYQRMVDDMDIDAGVVLAGYPLAELGREIFELILAVADGQQAKSEQLGVGAEEFVPWHVGPTL
jgi:altronate hydrolase